MHVIKKPVTSDALLLTTNFTSSRGSILSLASGFFPAYEWFSTSYNRFCTTRERLRTTLVAYYPVLMKDFSASAIKQFIVPSGPNLISVHSSFHSVAPQKRSPSRISGRGFGNWQMGRGVAVLASVFHHALAPHLTIDQGSNDGGDLRPLAQ